MSYEDSSVLIGQKCHYKMKSKIMSKFFSEPVDALDLRLTNLEASLTVISDPWSVKSKAECEAAPLDCSEVEVSSSSLGEAREDVQFITASCLKSASTTLVSPSIARHVSGQLHHHQECSHHAVAPQLLLDISFSLQYLQGSSDSRDGVKMFSSYDERGLATLDPADANYAFQRESSKSPDLAGAAGRPWRQRLSVGEDRGIVVVTNSQDTLKTEMMEGESVLDQKISLAEGLGLHDNPLLSSKQSFSACAEGRLRYNLPEVLDRGTELHQNPEISPSPQYLARSYQLLTGPPHHRSNRSPWTNLRSESVIVRNEQAAGCGKIPSWLDNLARLRSSYMAYQFSPSLLPSQPPVRIMFPPVETRSSPADEVYHNKHCPDLPGPEDNIPSSSTSNSEDEVNTKSRRGRPRKHAPKIPLLPLYVFIRNLLHNRAYNPSVICWVDQSDGCFKISNTTEFARTWGKMKANRSEEMNYEKMSRAMRYHYGSERKGRKGHLAMVKEKRLYYRFGELAVNWNQDDMKLRNKTCKAHRICREFLCLWTKE